MSEDFVWRDAGRTVAFQRQAAEQAPVLLREHGFGPFELIGSRRALACVEGLVAAAAAVHEVAPGAVPEASAAMLDRVEGKRLVAVGGGRTIDTAKAIASVTGAEVAALATTMSGAEMTGIHRLPSGAEGRAHGLVRPCLVIADPALMTSQEEGMLRASAMNALAHAADSFCTPFANPVSTMAGVRGAAAIAAALDQPREERSAAALATGGILCSYAIDSALFGVHHVLCQTIVQRLGLGHAQVNAAVLPATASFLIARAPVEMAEFVTAVGSDSEDVGNRVRELGGGPAGLGELGADRARLDEVIEAALARPQLAYSPGPPGRAEIEQLIEAAW